MSGVYEQALVDVDHTPVTFVMERVRRDGRKELLSGCDARGKLKILQKAIDHKIELTQPVWLKIHRDPPGTKITKDSKLMGMVFTVKNINMIDIVPLSVIVEEIRSEDD